MSSSLDGCSVVSEDSVVCGGGGGAREEGRAGEEDVEFYLSSQIDQLTDKR